MSWGMALTIFYARFYTVGSCKGILESLLFMYDAEIMDADKNAVIEWKDVPGEWLLLICAVL